MIAEGDEAAILRIGPKEESRTGTPEELFGEEEVVRRNRVIASALTMGRKYQFDELHARTVAKWAVKLFDRTRALHRLGLKHRFLLEVAALVHDIGGFVGVEDHHKHSQYLLLATPIAGLTAEQVAVVSNIARYHRKSLPKPHHVRYKALSSRDQKVVSKLAAILRIADAMDNEHASRVSDVAVEHRKKLFTIRLYGNGGLAGEKEALKKKARMFERVYGVRFAIAE